ncbi:MAG: 30S ribosomal protein THX [Flavobacteriales bacterium]|nr:MAG: 30S ribosomal protein THX [Flavobacteriales bacterium]
MGKGDKKTKKGKISSGSYGVLRKRKKEAVFVAKPKKKVAPEKEEALVAEETAKETPAKKPVAKKAPAKKKPAAKK